jgi:hypoxanthine phosphoribosyltransferase
MGLRCEYMSWSRFNALSARLAGLIRRSGLKPEMLVAVGRGGYLPARLLSDFLDIMDLATFRIEHYHGSHKEALALVRHPLSLDLTGKRVLLVDDVSDSGDTFEVALDHVAQHGPPAELRTAVLDHKITSSYVPDYYARTIHTWRWITYPWALVEDLKVLIGQMESPPTTLEALRRRLLDDHHMRVPASVLAEVAKAGLLPGLLSSDG